MKNTKNKMEDWELKEIGSLIVEILNRGQSLEFVPLKSFHPKNAENPSVSFNVPGISYLGICPVNDENFLELIGGAVDKLREENLEPTRAEELAALVENDLQFSQIGEVSGSCVCGSAAPLIVKSQITARAAWSGEIGTCPDCLKNYKLQNHV